MDLDNFDSIENHLESKSCNLLTDVGLPPLLCKQSGHHLQLSIHFCIIEENTENVITPHFGYWLF